MNFIKDILAYVDRPWKVGAVIILGLFGVVGWITYEKRDMVIRELIEKTYIELNLEMVDVSLDKLSDDTSADLVHIWAVNLSINSKRFLGGRRKDKKEVVVPNPRRIPAVTPQSDMLVLFNNIIGYSTCVDVEGRDSVLIKMFRGWEMVRVCSVPIPSSPEALVGVIYLAWKVKPDEGLEDVAISAAREMSIRLTRVR